ncbi:MAG: peptidylprolyl isomerase [Sphingobium sp.]
MRSKLFLIALAGCAVIAPAMAQQPPEAPPAVESASPAAEAPPAAPAEAAPKAPPAPPAPPPVNLTVPKPAPAPETDQENILYLDLSTGGRVTIQLRPDIAPAHVERIKTLVNRGFYNGIVFHRVIDGFMAQTGDPTGTGMGGSDLPDIKSEFSLYPHLRGTVSAARAESPDSANSQFFIMFMPRGALDRKYTALGRVIAGMEYVDAIERGEPPENPSKIVRASMASQGVPAPAPAAAAPAAQEAQTPPK